jgi:hypothetical protein
MRWLVEVTPLGNSAETESVQVEADTWHAALVTVRAARGEAAGLSGFSIELLDNGCRAVDPASHQRYRVTTLADSVAAAATGAAHGVVTSQPPPAADATVVTSQIIFKREQDRTPSQPLTYREYVYLVPHGTTNVAAERLLQAQLALVRTSLAPMPLGKLVNLAAFDIHFKGRPPVAPLATLTWKDWHGTAVVSFPRARSHSEAPARSIAPGPLANVSNGLAPSAVDSITAHGVAPRAVPETVNGIDARPVAGADDEAWGHPSPVPAFPRPKPVGAIVLVPAPSESAAPPVVAVHAEPEPAPTVVALRGAEPPGVAPVAAPSDPPSVPRARVRGEDLIADLFEAMHDLHFLQDAVEAGSFCLALSMSKIPCRAGIVHSYDIDRREFVVTTTRGTPAAPLLLRRYPERDLALYAATRKRRAIILTYSTETEAQSLERYAAIGGVRRVLVAPAMLVGRFLGAIELIDPLDGQPFTDSDAYAMTYIAEQFAQFVAEHGIVTDPERIRR